MVTFKSDVCFFQVHEWSKIWIVPLRRRSNQKITWVQGIYNVFDRGIWTTEREQNRSDQASWGMRYVFPTLLRDKASKVYIWNVNGPRTH